MPQMFMVGLIPFPVRQHFHLNLFCQMKTRVKPGPASVIVGSETPPAARTMWLKGRKQTDSRAREIMTLRFTYSTCGHDGWAGWHMRGPGITAFPQQTPKLSDVKHKPSLKLHCTGIFGIHYSCCFRVIPMSFRWRKIWRFESRSRTSGGTEVALSLSQGYVYNQMYIYAYIYLYVYICTYVCIYTYSIYMYICIIRERLGIKPENCRPSCC